MPCSLYHKQIIRRHLCSLQCVVLYRLCGIFLYTTTYKSIIICYVWLCMVILCEFSSQKGLCARECHHQPMAPNILSHLATALQAMLFSYGWHHASLRQQLSSSAGITWLAGCRTWGSVGPAIGSRGLVAAISPPSYSPWGFAPGRGAIVHSWCWSCWLSPSRLRLGLNTGKLSPTWKKEYK